MGQQGSSLKPRALEDLMRMTSFTDKELQEWYAEFKKDAREGLLSKNEFIKLYDEIFPKSDAREFSNHVFRTFDVNKDGVLNFREFVIGLSLSLRGTFDEKLYWAFKIYDVDGNGFISRSEMDEIIAAIVAMCREKNSDDVPDEQFFVMLDKDHDGQVSWGEFRKGVYENKTMTRFLQKALNCPTGV